MACCIVDGYAGFERLTLPGNIVLAACWAHYLEHSFIWSVFIKYAEEPLIVAVFPSRLTRYRYWLRKRRPKPEPDRS